MTDENKLLKATEAFQKSVDETKAIAEDLQGKYASRDKVTEEFKLKADEAITKMIGLSDELNSLKKHVSTIENRDGDESGAKGVTGSQELILKLKKKEKAWATGDKERFQVKSLMNSDPNSAGALVVPQYAGHVELLFPQLTIYDLLTHGKMDGEQIYYTRETGFVNNAEFVKEGDKKPSSDLKFEKVIENAQVIAHYIDESRQVLSDHSQLQTIIDTRLRYGLMKKREDAILFGLGQSQGQMHGIIPQASEFKSPSSNISDANQLDILRLAILQAALAEYPIDGLVLNPIDVADIELLKDTTGNYVIGKPENGGQILTLWGKPVVETQSLAVGDFLAGAFKMGCTYYERWMAEVAISLEHGDNFTTNMATILAEERGALAVRRPEAFVKGKFGSGSDSGELGE